MINPCIYLVLDFAGQVLYVGQVVNQGESLKKYNALKNLEGAKISHIEVDEPLLHSVEKALIAWFKPPLNEPDLDVKRGIEALRHQKGFTQSQVAKALDIDVSTVRNWEKGRDGTKMFVRVAKLCELFDCKPSDLYEPMEAL